MKKVIRKALIVTSVATMMCLSLVGCAKKTECELCGEEKKCKEYEAELMGESNSGWFCNDCAETMEEQIKAFGGTWSKK